MRRLMLETAAIVVAIAYSGCVSSHGTGLGGDAGFAPPTVMQVPTLDGGTEPVWIYVAKPATPGPYPVVIYGHGQGTGNIVNCTPDRAPDDGDVQTGKRIANDLAARGYLAISIFYRNRGEGIPAIGELRARDHYILDARAFLAAAHLAHDLGGDSRVALIGVSMGSFPATWATAPLPEVADLQQGLDIVTTIPIAMLGNHIGNTGRSQGTLTTSDIGVRRTAIGMAALAAVGARGAIVLDDSLTAGDLDATTAVTPAGADLVRLLFIDAPDPTLQGCAANLPAACSADCFSSTFNAVATARGRTGATATDWLTSDTIEAIQYWRPPAQIDPGAATSNTMLAAQRALSPAYALTGPLRTKRLLPLTSLGDHVVTDQLAGSNAPAELYLARLTSTSVTIPDPVPVVQDKTCDHDNYLDPARPQCGWSITLEELSTAFAH